MAKQPLDMVRELNTLRYESNLRQKIDCTPNDNKQYTRMLKDGQAIPEGIFQYKNDQGYVIDSFYKAFIPPLSEQEKIEYILLKQNAHLKTINGYMTYFFVISIISLIAGVIAVMTILSNII